MKINKNYMKIVYRVCCGVCSMFLIALGCFLLYVGYMILKILLTVMGV